MTRATLTLIGVAAAGLLLWLGLQISPIRASVGEYWAAVGLFAAAGLSMALSQLLGGWTKWGWPRVSGNVFLIGFLPALIAGGWVVAAGEPGDEWLGGHVRAWSDDIGIDGPVDDLPQVIPALAFGVGLVLGLTFDTTGPRVRKSQPAAAGAEKKRPEDDDPADDRRVHIREGGAPTAPEPEAPPRSGEPTKE